MILENFKEMKTFEQFINDGYSNYKGITQFIRDKMDDNWNDILKKKKVEFSFEFDKKIITVKFGSIEGSKIGRIKDLNYLISINTSGKNLNRDNIIATIVHELTHFGQKFNKFGNYDRGEHFLDYNDFNYDYTNYLSDHDRYHTEKESVLLQLFELLRRKNVKLSISFCYEKYKYFNLYQYKKVINKALLYGISVDIFNQFRKELKEYLLNKINKNINKNYQLIERCYIITKQFNLRIEDNIKNL